MKIKTYYRHPDYQNDIPSIFQEQLRKGVKLTHSENIEEILNLKTLCTYQLSMGVGAKSQEQLRLLN